MPPSSRTHIYRLSLRWTGDLGEGTSSYGSYSRNHSIEAAGRPPLLLSSDPLFRGDAGRYSPEELLLASLSSCHMLWYLHLCADAGIVVRDYVDSPEGTMEEEPGGGGHFTEVVLRPAVTPGDCANDELAVALHADAHDRCFIARSVNFPVRCEPRIVYTNRETAAAADEP